MYIIQYFNTLLIYIYADTLTVTWGALIEGLPTDGEEGRREGKFFSAGFFRDGESKRKRTRECTLLYTKTPSWR